MTREEIKKKAIRECLERISDICVFNRNDANVMEKLMFALVKITQDLESSNPQDSKTVKEDRIIIRDFVNWFDGQKDRPISPIVGQDIEAYLLSSPKDINK